jgi:predicted lipid-binding transport protein (Tim44 family)
VIDGDPVHVGDVTDIWTFAREVSARDPNWKLIATESVE